MQEYIEISKALLTPLLAIIAAYIAWQQVLQTYPELVFLPKEKRVFDKQLNACS